MKLHYADDGPRDAPVLLFAGSLGSTRDAELAADAGRPVPGHPHRPPRPRRLPGTAAPVRDARRRRWRSCSTSWSCSRWRSAGCRWAGWSACTWARTPHRLTSLTLCCTTSHFADKAPWEERIAAVEAGGTAGIADAVVGRWFTTEWATPDVVTALRNQIADTPDTGYLACCRAISAWDHRERLAAVAVPTLVIGGVHRRLFIPRPARPDARRRHPRRAAGGAPRRPPRHDRERASRQRADFGARCDHKFITTPD